MLIGSDNRDAAFSAKTYIFEYHNVIMYAPRKIPKQYESVISVWDKWLLSYFVNNLKYMFVLN